MSQTPRITPRTVRTSDGYYVSHKAAERLIRHGRARWDGKLLQIIEDLPPADLNAALHPAPKPRWGPALRIVQPTRSANWSDLRPALQVWAAEGKR